MVEEQHLAKLLQQTLQTGDIDDRVHRLADDCIDLPQPAFETGCPGRCKAVSGSGLDRAAKFIRSDILGFHVYATSYITLAIMGRLLLILFAAAFTVAGTLIAVSALYATYRALNGPVTERDLLEFTGRVSRVSPCSTGRSARYEFAVSNAERTIESSAGCPSTQQGELARLVGSQATLRYVVYRDFYFLPRVRVYEFVAAGYPMWTFNESSSRAQGERWLINVLTVLGGFAGVGLAWLGWREVMAAIAPAE